MKKFLLAAAVLVVSMSAGPAHAAQLILDNMGTVSNGSASTSYSMDDTISATYYGLLPAMSKIVFTYDLGANATGLIDGIPTASLSSIGFKIGTADNAAATVIVGQPQAVSSDNLIVASAYLPSYSSGTATITNLRSEAINFQTILTAWLKKAVTLTVTTKVSSVPLPAALPLFGLGVASLAGLRARKKSKTAA